MAEAQVLNTADTVARVRGYLVGLQARITDALEAVEGEGGARFLADAWSKPPGEPLQGDGITKIMEGGRVVLEGEPDVLAANEDVKEFYLGLTEMGSRKSYHDVKHYKRRKRWLS